MVRTSFPSRLISSQKNVNCSHGGSPHEFIFLQRLTTFIQFYCGPPVVSVDGAVGEDEGSSAVVGTTVLGLATVGTMFGSVAGGTTLTSDLAFAMVG